MNQGNKFSPIIKPEWPDNRSFSRYLDLLGESTFDGLKSGGIWIDVGAGSKAAGMLGLLDWDDVELVAVSFHRMQLDHRIKSVYAWLPEDLELLEEYRQRSLLVTDVYGSVSYCDNPLQALIYESCLLAEDGELRLITESGRFRPSDLAKKIGPFLERHLGLVCHFEEVTTVGDATQRKEKVLKIILKRATQMTQPDLQKLYGWAEKEVGIPIKSSQPLWTSSNGHAAIFAINYVFA